MTVFFDAVSNDVVYELLLKGCSGKITGVFSSSAYCLLENGKILLFHEDRYGIIPFGIGLADMGSFLSWAGVLPGASFRCGNLIFDFPGSGRKTVLRLSRRNPAAFSEEPLQPSGEIRQRVLKAEAVLKSVKPDCFGIINTLLKTGEGIATGGESEVCRLMRTDVFDSLLQGIAADASGEIEAALCRLAGLGYGLTPTMDDILTGLAYMFRFMERKTGRLPSGAGSFLELLTAEKIYGRTSVISSAYFRSAASGGIFSLFEDAAAAMASAPETGRSNEAVKFLLAVGSESGANILAGLLMGLLFITGLPVIS